MNMKKYIKIALRTFAAAVVGLSILSCDSDLDNVYVLPSDDIALGGASGDIVLSPENPQALAMTLYWSGDGRLSLSDPAVQGPVSAAETTIQFSADESFSLPLEIPVDKGVVSRQFLSEELNALLGRLGYVADQSAPLWIRIGQSLSSNIAPKYSNVVKVMVQSYRISLVIGHILDKDWNETSMTLASPGEDGVYRGFMGVAGWYNWWFREANNIVWGNLGEDGKTFYASSDDSHWNFWFPDPAGCYFTTLNTVEGWWSALHIDNLSVSGDIAGEMVFNQKTNQWTMPVSLSAAANVTINVSGAASLYDKNTTDMGPAVTKTVWFSGDSQNLTFGEASGSVTVQLPAGETTLILDLTDPLKWTIAPGEAAEAPITPSQLYFSGLVDWDDIDDYLTLYDEAGLCYGGAHYINSEWGYRVYPEQAWSPAYKGADGSNGLSGSLVLAQSGNDGNVPAPEAGLYVMDFNMKGLTYELTKIETVSFVGLNDDWSEHVMTQSADNAEVFTGEFQKTADTPWGAKVLINGSWSLFFGGGGEQGTLMLGHSDSTSGFEGDNELEIGKNYILTVDLGKQTYSYSLK